MVWKINYIVTLGIREATDGSAQEIRPKIYRKACITGKAGSMSRLKQRRDFLEWCPWPRTPLTFTVVLLVGMRRCREVLIAEGIIFLPSILFLFNEN